jgi:LuxR family maltose regulon positive regulatory protein
LVKGQAKDFHTMVDDYEFRISKVNYTLYPRYMEALRVWCALYSGQYDYCEDWLLNRAPRDTDVLTILDIYNVLVKLRIYLLLGKYYLVISIAVRLIPTLEDWHRTMDACETRLIYAMALFSDNNLEKAYEVLDGVLPVIKRFHYYRLVADEGQKMYNMLRLYKKSRRTNDGFIDLLISLSKQMGIMYPNYLKKLSENYPSLTDTEKSVLRLMADERTNADIADYMSVSINTVKFHSKNIFMKLNVNNRHQAIKIALESNII